MSLSAEQARDLADRFLEMAEAVKTYRSTHRSELPPAERQTLADAEIELRNNCSKLTTVAVGLTLDGVHTDLQKLMAVTTGAQRAIAQVQNVKKAIIIATAAIKLGVAIASQDPAAIASAVDNLDAKITA